MAPPAKLTGASLREAARNNKLGTESLCYSVPQSLLQGDFDEFFERYLERIRDIVGKNQEEGSFNQVTTEPHSNTLYVQVNLAATFEKEGEGFDDAEEETRMRTHSLVEKDTGNIYLAQTDNSPALEYGIRANIFDTNSYQENRGLNSNGGDLRVYRGTVMELVSLGVKVDDVNSWGETALMQAAVKGHADVCEWLLKSAGANPNIEADSGATALMKAVEKGVSYLKICEILTNYGADVNHANQWGFTALHIAAFRGYIELAEFLLQNGADRNLCNNEGHTAAYYSEERNCEIDEKGERCYNPSLEELL